MQLSQSLSVWQFINSALLREGPVALLYVVESDGSSPGRQGFCMAASPDACVGTIGGGVMEYKLVELSRKKIAGKNKTIVLKTQFHDKDHSTDQSGMICSGRQRVVIVPLEQQHREVVQDIISVFDKKRQVQLRISPTGIALNRSLARDDGLSYEGENTWVYQQVIGLQPRVHIVGAGHVSLALSELMSKLGFYVLVYDDRQGLNTYLQNHYADEKHIVDYSLIGDAIPDNEDDYLVIMTIGYRTDKEVLLQLIKKRFKYIGMLGSAAKISTLYREFLEAGIEEMLFSHVRSPIGLQIRSQTAHEIAVSIAAEIIQEKNKTG